jgi:hypothetical protein
MSRKVAFLESVVARLEKQNQETTRAVSRPTEVLPSPTDSASIGPYRSPSDRPPHPGSFVQPPPFDSAVPSVPDTNTHRRNGTSPERWHQRRSTQLASSPLAITPPFPVGTLESGRGPSSRPDAVNGISVSALHTRVANSIHGRTSAFHPQSFLSMPARASENTDQQGHLVVEPLQSSTAGDEDELRAKLFSFAAAEKQKEHIYGLKGQYDLDGVDYESAMHLLELHWNHQHCAYLSTYRPAIMHSLANNGPHASKLLLNALYFSSSLNSDRLCFREDPNDPQTTGNRFLARFHELMIPSLEKSSIPTALAIGQVGSSLVACGRQTIGWLYAGLARRMIADLGIHVDPSKLHKSGRSHPMPDDHLSFIDVEVQRRTFWSAYVNDKFQSLYFGRPCSFPTTGMEPPSLYLDTYEEMELWAPYVDHQNVIPCLRDFVAKPSYNISTFCWLLRLAQISAELTAHLYMPDVGKLRQPSTLDHFTAIRLELDQWADELPAHLRYNPQEDDAPPAHQFNIQ